MHCPFCSHEETRVIDSRLVGDGEQIRRRRECTSCKERFTTYEHAELTLPRIIKNDGSRAPFDEAKLRAGIARAVEKRPVASDLMEGAISRIRHRLAASGERELPSRLVGLWVMDELRQLDEVAYVRFASVYRRFEDVHDFREELERLERELSPDQRRDQIPLLPGDGQ